MFARRVAKQLPKLGLLVTLRQPSGQPTDCHKKAIKLNANIHRRSGVWRTWPRKLPIVSVDEKSVVDFLLVKQGSSLLTDKSVVEGIFFRGDDRAAAQIGRDVLVLPVPLRTQEYPGLKIISQVCIRQAIDV